MNDQAGRFGVTIRALLLLLLCSAPAGAGEPSQPKVNGTLTEIGGIPVLRVWGTPHERGYAQGFLLADKVVPFVDAYLAGGTLGGSAEGFKQQILPKIDMWKLEPQYEEELRGLLEGLEARTGSPVYVPSLGRNLQYEDMLACNYTADLTRLGCSSFAAWGPMTKDGSTLAGRNLDWPAYPALLQYPIIVVNVPSADSGELAWVSVTFPGYIGLQTGMNAEGVTVSMHDAGGFPSRGSSGFTPRAFALREALESAHAATAFEDVARVLRERVCIVGNNVPVNRPYVDGRPAAAVFEYDGGLSKEQGVTARYTPEGENFLICTNHYRKRTEPTPCGRYEKLDKRLGKIAKSGGKKHLTEKMAWKMLKGVSMEGITTLHSVVFEPNKRLMHVAFAKKGKPAPQCKPITLDVAELVRGTGTAAEQGP